MSGHKTIIRLIKKRAHLQNNCGYSQPKRLNICHQDSSPQPDVSLSSACDQIWLHRMERLILSQFKALNFSFEVFFIGDKSLISNVIPDIQTLFRGQSSIYVFLLEARNKEHSTSQMDGSGSEIHR